MYKLSECEEALKSMYLNTIQEEIKAKNYTELLENENDFQENITLLKENMIGQQKPIRKYYNKLEINPKTKIGRNAPCPCNSGLKYKKCCGK